MKSGLEDRNNERLKASYDAAAYFVSMKSGLEDRNNPAGAFPGESA